MLNLGAGEVVVILVVALLILGPKRLPELARGIGKFMREFRRQTDEVRSVVEREFYRMDQDLNSEQSSPSLLPVQAPRPPATLMAEASTPSSPGLDPHVVHTDNAPTAPGGVVAAEAIPARPAPVEPVAEPGGSPGPGGVPGGPPESA